MDFTSQLRADKQAIDDAIAVHAAEAHRTVAKQYGPAAALEASTFFDVLARGGKRIRGVLVLAGYRMAGGRNERMIVQAACAIEMLHAYMLIIDDIQDRSLVRRGQPTAHRMLANYHRAQGLKGNANHTGLSIALMSALYGAHRAQLLLGDLDVSAERRLAVLQLINTTLITTAHGQTQDIMNGLVQRPNQHDIDRVLEWKTAQYTVINPLQVGLVLAGADATTVEAIAPFGMQAGKAFQIIDDILGIFGHEHELGKTPGDDIREGKSTLLTQYALQHANIQDQQFLQRCLGDPKLVPAAFIRCQDIIKASGALEAAQKTAANHAAKALAVLDAPAAQAWQPEGRAFLRSLVQLLQHRLS